MKENRPFTLLFLVLAGMLLVACGGSAPAGEPEPDRVATRVAEDLAVAATLTAAVPSPEASPTSPPGQPSDTALLAATATQPPPTDAPQAVATATSPPPGPTSTPPPAATDAPPPPTATPPPPPPTNTPPPPPPTPTPVLIAVLPVDGGGAEFAHIRNNNPVKDGRNISLPGFAQNEVSNPMVYRDRIVFRAEVFDDNYGTKDGDGIENVTFAIFDSGGNLVHERTENNPAYCVFGGGEPDCEVLVFDGAETRWPGGASLTPGLHQAEIAINPLQGEVVTWLWSFEVDIPQNLSASIENITIQGDRYAVEFKTQGFVPQLPGQHVHFFFDTVPPDQAGVPGSGPWILYGGPSPFTEYGLADRPAAAYRMCILVANPDHSVQANSGNCWDLP